MVQFKIYDKKLQKFVQLSVANEVWDARYKLGIWNNSVIDDKLGEMYTIMKKNYKHLELYVKIGGRFKPVSKEVIDKQYKGIYKKNARNNIKIRKSTRKRQVKECKKTKTYKLPHDKRCL